MAPRKWNVKKHLLSYSWFKYVGMVIGITDGIVTIRGLMDVGYMKQ